MKKLLVILFCFISFSVFAEELHMVPQDIKNTDFHNKRWFWGTQSIGDAVFIFMNKFGNSHIERTIAKDNLSSLQEPYRSICKNLLDRGRNTEIPKMTFMVMIICDDKYGVLLYWWNDTQSFGSFQAQGMVLMGRQFFELKRR